MSPNGSLSKMALTPYYRSQSGDFSLYHGDLREVIPQLPKRAFDLIFADPPYFLSNGGFSVHAGKCVSVDKGVWDKSQGIAADTAFNHQWIAACREVLAENGTIWVCGTYHNIFSVAQGLTELDFRVLNVVTWQKSNPPPNLSCRTLTHSTEFLVWARKSKRVPHVYNYDLMHRLAGNRQMTDVWRLPAIAPWEKTCGKHPTQKPIALLVRAILASTHKGAWVLDPFTGSSTTGIAANLLSRNFCGIDAAVDYLALSQARRERLEHERDRWYKKVPDLALIETTS